MKKLGLIFRETLENRIKSYLKESHSVFVITYAKLSSPDLSSLRQSLRGTAATLFVAKNSVARRALKDSKAEGLVDLIQGPCGMVFVKDEPVDASKALCNFSKDHGQLKLEGGFLKDKLINKNDIETLAKIPSKEILRAQVVMGLKSPIFGIVTVLKATLRKVVYCLEQVKEKKSTVDSPQSTAKK